MRRNPAGRKGRGRRRSGGSRRGGMVGGIMSTVKSTLNKDMLEMAAGLYGSSILMGFVNAKWGPVPTGTKDPNGNALFISGSSSLPGLIAADGTLSKPMLALYNFAVPVLAGFVVSKYVSKTIGQGIILSAPLQVMNQFLNPIVGTDFLSKVTHATLPAAAAASTGTQAASAFIGTRGMRAYLPGVGRIPGPRNFTAVDQFSYGGTTGKLNVLPSNAFARR